MSTFVNTYPTARKRHACGLCDEGIRPGEMYRRGVWFDGGTAWTWKECLWCERAAAAYMRLCRDVDEYLSDWVIEWLADDHPTVYALMRAGWSYPDGERVPLPFQCRCRACGVLLHGYRLWCPPCDEERIARISGQLTAISDELHERTTR